MRFAILGCGVIARAHAAVLTALAPLTEFVLAVDPDPERARELAAEFGARWSAAPDETLDRTDVDAVVVCVPSGLHAAVAADALAAGKHVVIEKPLDVSLDGAARVAEAERISGRTAMVISQYRFTAAARAVREAVAEGRFGSLTSGLASVPLWRDQSYYDVGGWHGTSSLEGGGALITQAIHTIDLLVWLLGEPVTAFGHAARLGHERIEVEDTAAAVVRFEGGALGIVHGSTAAYPGLPPRLQIHGTSGSAVIGNTDLEYFHAAGPGVEPAPPYGTYGGMNQASTLAMPVSPVVPGLDEVTLPLLDQYRDFLAAVAEGRPPLVSVTEATRTLAVIQAIYESARTGSPVAVAAPAPAPDPAPAPAPAPAERAR